jgi:hypothetical protein
LERSTETKNFSKSSEFFVYVIAAAAILIASLIVDGFNATEGGCSSPTSRSRT